MRFQLYYYDGWLLLLWWLASMVINIIAIVKFCKIFQNIFFGSNLCNFINEDALTQVYSF